MSDFPKKSERSSTSPIDCSFFDSPNPSREDVANFLIAHADMIRRRIRGKLAAMRRRSESNPFAAIDEDDIFSTLCRRLDQAVVESRFKILSEPEFWAYVHRVTDNAILASLRDDRPHMMLDLPDNHAGTTGDHVLASPDASLDNRHKTDETLAECLAITPNPADRHLIELKAKGIPYTAIAAATGRSRDALRTQWSKLSRLLRARSVPRHEPPAAHAARL